MAAEVNHCVFDVETGGLDDTKSPIVQITVSFLNGDLEDIESYTSMVKPYGEYREINAGALKANGLSLKDIEAGSDIREVVEKISDLFVKYGGKNSRQLILVGHNVSFDVGFLLAAFNYCGDKYTNILDTYVSDSPVDTLRLSRYAFKGEDMKFNLSSCCEKAGIVVTDAHRSDVDVAMTADLFRFLIGRLQSSGSDSARQASKYERSFKF